MPIISPLCFDVSVFNGECYLEMGRNYCSPELKRLKLTHNTGFQQGGAPCYSSCRVRQFLNQVLPAKWFGRGVPRAWPARSPYSSPADLLLWGIVTTVLYLPKPRSTDDFTIDAINVIPETHIQNVFVEFKYIIIIWIRNDGWHIET
jgi:hypothetical protein